MRWRRNHQHKGCACDNGYASPREVVTWAFPNKHSIPSAGGHARAVSSLSIVELAVDAHALQIRNTHPLLTLAVEQSFEAKRNNGELVVMEAHEISPLESDHRDMTGVACDIAVMEDTSEQPRRSTLQDQDWAEMINSHFQNNATQTSSGNMEFDLFNLGDVQAQFVGLEDFLGNDTVPSYPNNSSSSTIYDTTSAPITFQPWQAPVSSYRAGCECPPSQPFEMIPWMPEQHYHQTLDCGLNEHEALGNPMAPTSHPIQLPNSVSSTGALPECPMSAFGNATGLGSASDFHEQRNLPHEDNSGDDDDRHSAESTDPCYAQLLYQCLKEAPHHTLTLRELYDWVSRHSQKAKDPKNRGWQNSVRHNLSMNAAFARVPHEMNSGPKKGSLWRLTEDALREGVISTTRYRKDPKRRPERRSTPALNRQASGAKGGRATRDASRFRQQQQNRSVRHIQHPSRFQAVTYPHYAAQYSPHPHSAEISPQRVLVPPTPAASPYFIDEPVSLSLPLSAPQTPPGQHPMSTSPPPGFRMEFDNAQYRKPHAFSNFEFLPLDHTQGGVFGDHDPEIHRQQQTHTPASSLMTEASFVADEHLPLMPMIPYDMVQDAHAV